MSRRALAAVPAAADGERLDVFLAGHTGEPRNRVQQWIRAGRVTLDGRPSKPSHRLAGGERLEWEPPEEPFEERLAPEAGELRVLYEDAAVAVLDKPAGIAVHPGAGRATGTLAHRILARYPETAGVGGPGRPGIVHRLDKDTTGVMVVARTAAAYRALGADFAGRRVEKTYLALVYGRPEPPRGRIEEPIGRHPQRRKEMTVRTRGRPARTDYRVLGETAGISALEVGLGTGRTHQIRVHLKARGHPLVGDPTYGEARWRGLPAAVRPALRGFGRPALHAWRLAFAHPARGERVSFEAPPPDDLRRLWAALGGGEVPLPGEKPEG